MNIDNLVDPDLMLEIVRESPVIAFDTETTGLERKDIVCGWVVTDEGNSLYTPVRHEAGGNIPDVAGFEAELARAFADRGRRGLRTVGHNLGFDLRMALKHGMALSGHLEDTMINEALIDDRTIGYSLDDSARRWGVTAKKGDELYRAIAARFGGLPDRTSMKHFWRMPGDDFSVLDYATGDGVSTLEVWHKQQPVLDAEELRKVWQLECDLLPYLARMHHRGLRIDSDYAARVMGEIKDAIEKAQRVFPAGFNARSPKEVEALFRANGFIDSDFALTETGKFSFTEKWLLGNSIGQEIIGVRQLEKARDSFITPLIDTKNIGGRVHPTLNQSKSDEYGVAGARLSCSDPNLQAFPKRNKKVGKVVRPLVCADDGMLFEEADFQQQEPRLFTHYSEDPVLIEGYRRGTMDMHDRASEVLGLDRDTAKRLGMGMLTMMYPKTLAKHMSCDLSTAKMYHRQFLTDAFPLINEFQKDAIAVFVQRGYVKTLLGRRARWDGDKRGDYKAVSRIIQNNGGDHMKTALLRANQYEDAYPDQIQVLLSIHDSTIWQRDPGHSPKELVRVIENVAHEPDFNLLVPIPVELGSGKDWGAASYGDKLKDKQGWISDRA